MKVPKIMRKLVIAYLLLCYQAAWSTNDVLIVQRSSLIKDAPSSSGKLIERVNEGDTLALLDNGNKTNGYYQVMGPATGEPGFIYQNRVRRRIIPIPVEIVNGTLDWPGTIPADYYSGTQGLEGDELKDRLNDIIQDHREFPYTSATTDVWDILKQTDRDLLNPEHVRLLYTSRSRDAEAEYDNGRGWTREHVWAKSHGNFGTTKGAGTDVHALRPVDASVNSARNNKDFDNGGEEYIDGNFPSGNYGDEDSWEPADNVKGDVARMIFYMAVRYEGEGDELDLQVIESVDTYPLAKHGNLSTLLEWHELDPVDSWERRRNDIIFEQFQGNRNPFIDHPEFVALIWSN